MRKFVYKPNDLVTGPEAIKLLGLKKTDELKPLVERNLLVRWKFSSKEVKYLKSQCEALFNRKMVEHISYKNMRAA